MKNKKHHMQEYFKATNAKSEKLFKINNNKKLNSFNLYSLYFAYL